MSTKYSTSAQALSLQSANITTTTQQLTESTELTREYIAANLWIGNQRADKGTVDRMYRSCKRKQRTDHTDHVAPFASRPFSLLR